MIRALRTAVAGFRAHRGMFLASGLAFNMLVCLIPILFFLVSLVGFVLSRRAAVEVVVNQLAQFVPVYRDELHSVLAEIVRRRNLSGLLGTAVLLLFVMGVLFLASTVMIDLFDWLKILLMVPVGMPPEWIRSSFVALAVGFNTALFFVAYRYFPHRKVPVGPALAGALLASVLWEAAKQLFRWYILTLGVYDKVYGPLGALVALNMFAYYSGVVFVLGAEFAAALRTGGRARG